MAVRALTNSREYEHRALGSSSIGYSSRPFSVPPRNVPASSKTRVGLTRRSKPKRWRFLQRRTIRASSWRRRRSSIWPKPSRLTDGVKPGERVGVYTVLNRLGGASGEVWRAKDERLGRDVAIKIVLPHTSSDPERMRRFAEEARLAGSLNHPNLLTVHDVGEHAGLPMLVTECLDGQSLRRRLEAGPLPVGKAINVAVGIARGLSARTNAASCIAT